MNNPKTYNEFIKEIKDNWLHHQMEAERFKNLYELAAKEDGFSVNSIPLVSPTKAKVETQVKTLPSKMNGNHFTRQKKVKKETFEDKILEILNEKGRPMYVSELLDAYKEKTGLDILSKNFSSKLAIVAKNKNTILNKEYKELPSKHRFWWGLREWYRDNDFESPFKDKIMIEAENIGEVENIL